MLRHSARHTTPRAPVLIVVVTAGLAVGIVASSGGAAGAPSQIPLGNATSFAVLAGAGTTNTGPTTITGDIGTFPTTTLSGMGSVTLHGTNYAGGTKTQAAKTSLTAAYINAAGQGPRKAVTADLGGQTLVAGVYRSASSLGLTGVLTLDAKGNPYAVFVFQAGSTLTTASESSVVLVNGAQPCNVYRQVGSSATLGTGSTFRGTILALTSITLTTGVTVDGRVLARNGAVTMDTNTITRSVCTQGVGASPTPTPSQIATPPHGGVGTGS